MEDSRIPDFQECPGASNNTSGDVDVAYTMGTDMWAPVNVVLQSRKGVRSVELFTIARCIRVAITQISLFAGDNLGPGRGWSGSTAGVLCLPPFDRFVPMHSAV